MTEAATSRPQSTADAPWPVRVVSMKIGQWVARLGEVWVEGQVAQVSRRPGAPTVFLTLRDPAADISVSVTCARIVYDAVQPPLTEGARVLVHAKPDYYLQRGTLSLRATELRAVGIGELLARLARLKELLAAEGLFAVERKRKLPFLPGTIGLVTGRASAAERDVLENAKRRWPAVRFEVRPVAVQGTQAVPQILDALRELDKDPDVDVIILARGGGSVEDLLPFSDETLCRAVFSCRTPIVSAIGHETDTPLVDYVADVRCSTPTDAAKRVVPDLSEERQRIDAARQRMLRCIVSRLEAGQQWLDGVRSRPAFAQPTVLIDQREADVDGLRERARRTLGHRLDAAGGELAQVRARVRALSPQATLDRGYAVVQTSDGSVLRDASDASTGDALRVRLASGEVTATVTES
ncbi:exodeoxyribonuclease VII large subunit [Cryptosporangium phraense]|uniref:Exodeoxyribonuclease 7 large subunit n=1 Tax=Cryptosporangium phraense TaxID=2593070 RepID=A0A545AZ14_9ACTN|nr:exodeoxyribonuclease VII large subunit [Cryptosporangium phraense]TQS46573.1 exodeoxyribonuclease VII large subunit [Cryptosporangium phraense]